MAIFGWVVNHFKDKPISPKKLLVLSLPPPPKRRYTGWWFQPPEKYLKNMKVRLDHHPNYWGK
jgi:hypothetical protein